MSPRHLPTAPPERQTQEIETMYVFPPTRTAPRTDRRPRLLALAALAAALPLFPADAPAQAAAAPQAAVPALESRTHQVTRATSPVRVDGVLDEAAWADAPVIDLPFEYFPADNAPAPVRTECRITYDDANLYLGCVAYDPEPARIRANLTDRDAALADDHVVLMIDPFNDQRRAFQFRVNPLGVQMDAMYDQLDGREDLSWDAIWKSAGRITDEGYVVEVAIPFNSLRFPRTAAPQTWGMFLERVYPRNVVHRMRSIPTNRNQACLLCQADRMEGLVGIRPGRGVELTPTLTTRRSDARADFPTGAMERGEVDPQFGLSGQWGITPNTRLNATYNPDFSQVEADVARLEVNERFALLYPEKRPFFLEGADFFRTPASVVYTRSVIDPLGGVKLTGKSGSNAYGAFGARDRVNLLLFPSNAGTRLALMDEEVNTAVARFRRDVGASSTVGVLYTGRMGEGYQNHVAGVDGLVRLSPTKFVRWQYSRSETDYPDEIATAFGQSESSFGGDNVFAQFVHASRHWQVMTMYEDIGRGYRADAGFIPRADVRAATATVERVFWGGRDSWYRRLSALGFFNHTRDYEGQETDRGSALVLNYHGARQSVASLGAGHNRRFVRGTMHDVVDVRPSLRFNPAPRARLSFDGRFGEDVDFTNNRKANLFQLQPGVDVRVGRRLHLAGDYTIRRLTTQGDDPAGGGHEIVDARLTQARVLYHLGMRTFVRAIVQYEDITRDPALWVPQVQPEVRNLFTQFLFAYRVNPQTVVFAGYTDDRLGLETVDLTSRGRTLFLKMGYNWQP